MRSRTTALLLGAAVLMTALGAGPRAAMADPSKTDQSVWTARIETGDRRGAGTDSRVFLYVDGTNASFGPQQLITTGAGVLERNTITPYTFNTAVLGDITRLCLWRDNSGFNPSWYVDEVRVDGQTFGFDRWIPNQDWECSYA